VVYPLGGSDHKSELSSQKTPYRLQASWKPQSANELQSDADTIGLGAAVEMLAKIYGSEDQLLIGAINTDLRAFCEAVDRKQRDRHSTQELINLKKRLATIEKQLKQDKPS
jgi:hypothetical protein